jgi:hypothetical protein
MKTEDCGRAGREGEGGEWWGGGRERQEARWNRYMSGRMDGDGRTDAWLAGRVDAWLMYRHRRRRTVCVCVCVCVCMAYVPAPTAAHRVCVCVCAWLMYRRRRRRTVCVCVCVCAWLMYRHRRRRAVVAPPLRCIPLARRRVRAGWFPLGHLPHDRMPGHAPKKSDGAPERQMMLRNVRSRSG